MASYPQYSVGKPNMDAISPPIAMAINIVASQLGVAPGHVAAIIGSETAGSFRPNVTSFHDGKTYTGAIQYSPSNLAIAAAKMGMTVEALTDSLVAEIMAIPNYALDAGFVRGQHKARQLYASI